MNMHRATIIKLYPSDTQADLLHQHLGVVRWVWNHFLALRTRHYKMFGHREGFKSLRYNRSSKHLTKIKQKKDFLTIPHSHALQAKLQDLDTAFINLWKHKKGFPKFKSKKKGRDTMRFDRMFITIEGNKIRIEKVGWMKFRGRVLDGQLRNVTIRRTLFGLYEASLMYEVEKRPRKAGGLLGIDMNCHNLTRSDGVKHSLFALSVCGQDKEMEQDYE